MTVARTNPSPPQSKVESVDDRSDRVAVIGAGTSGLTAVKNLLEHGVRVDCFERESDLGGNWNAALPCSRVIDSTHLISSKQLTEYLDHPMPKAWPEYPSHRLVLEYLQSYADRFALREHLEFNSGVRRVEPIDANGDERGWLVELESGERRRYGRLLIANGHNWDHSFPAWSGRVGESAFGGVELHSGEYKSPQELLGKRVLVVGGGNSGCDIAVESSQHAKATRLSLRRGYHFLPKFFHGTPIDVCGERMLWCRVPLALRRFLAHGMIFLMLGTREGTGLPRPDHRLFEAHPVVTSTLVYHLRHGDLAVRPDVESLTETGVRFVDGREEAYDVIVYATGYRLTFPFIDNEHLNWRDGRPRLHLNVFHPQRDDLFVIGMMQPDSGSWGLADRQARLVAQYLIASEQGTAAARKFDAARAADSRPKGSIRYLKTDRHLIEVEHSSYRSRVDRAWKRLRRGVRQSVNA
ncbi:4-hydroxyacetophenone monooxygenase [Planctomycetes bacterium MalM25]|nr:4-hydroxyacetophenone monooxygenase [Planctomycetes bacterium MalM25]